MLSPASIVNDTFCGNTVLGTWYAYCQVPAEIISGHDVVTEPSVRVVETPQGAVQVPDPGLKPTPIPPWMTLFTAIFMHGSIMHLAGNMWFLWIFGDNVEDDMGHAKYLVFYLISGVAASLAFVALNAVGFGQSGDLVRRVEHWKWLGGGGAQKWIALRRECSRLARVVVAIEDPNPLVAGKGVALLREAGIVSELGLLADEAREMNIGFFSRMKRGRPWVRMKCAASLDGRTAYWSDTFAHCIYAFDLDEQGLPISERRLWHAFAERAADTPIENYGGRPDGAAMHGLCRSGPGPSMGKTAVHENFIAGSRTEP